MTNFVEKIQEQVQKWEDENIDYSARLDTLFQTKDLLEEIALQDPSVINAMCLVQSLIFEYLERVQPTNQALVDQAMMQIQNITSMYFHDQQVNLPRKERQLQDQKKTYMMLKVLMARIHTQLYPEKMNEI